MKTILRLTAAAVLITNFVFSQTPPKGKISGEIQEKTAKPLSFATVLLLKAKDSTLVKGAITNESGYYEIEGIAFGKYLVAANMMGYQKTYSAPFEISESQTELKLAGIQVLENTQTIGEVKVVAKRPFIEQEIDRTVLNIENSVVSAGGTALEVLEKAPGVTVDQQNDRLVVKGKQGVIVMMDGKQTYLSTQEVMNLLRNMPSDNLEKIEIISNPSSKYDAAGNVGIINIKTKKNKNFGTNGTSTMGGGYGRYEKMSATINLNHREGATNIYGNYSGRYGRNFNDQLIYRNIPFEGKNTIFDQNGSNINRNQGHTFKAGLDWFVNKKSTFGIMLNGFINNYDGTSISNTFITAPTQSTKLVTTNTPTQDLKNITANLNYKYDFGQGREFTADADYSRYNGSSSNNLDSRFSSLSDKPLATDLMRNFMPSNINIWAAKVDYVHPLKKGKIETGLKSSLVSTDNDMKFEVSTDGNWVVDPKRTNRFMYDENINAAYMNYSTQLNKKMQFQAGLRAEHTHSKGNSVTLNNVTERDYVNLFPSVFLSRQLDSNNVLNLSYSRRIDRPSYQDLNPFEFYLDPYTFERGNPYLKPQYTNAYSLTHTFKGEFSTTLSYSRTNDLIQEDSPDQIAAENKTLITTVNVDKFDNISLNISFPVHIMKWWTMQNNFTVFHNRYNTYYRGSQFELSNTAYNLYLSNSFVLPKSWTAEISGWYNSAGIFGFFSSTPMGAFNLGAQKSWNNGKIKARINFQDPFWLNQFKGSTQFQDLNFSVHSRWESRILRVSVTYRFGNQNVKAARQRSTSAEDLKNRTGAGQN